MKLAMRTGLAAVVAAAALTVAAPPAGAAGAKSDHAAAGPDKVSSVQKETDGRRVLRPRAGNPIQISPAAYNQARSILAKAGSMTAAKSHPQHGTTGVPARYGVNLLACARDEYRAHDKNLPLKQSGMSPYHYIAIHDAAKTMGISRW
ncbi:hypothetical protein LE181_07910 [Streptomyces sp. SCA3-4]|uniref:hypothetical protein n=1 Tax=Streptomyces sichuanensis TaxID=2871810 RepID=UPI001CE35175|nr:hypothetical protein [Streptomyces sichuanensis]MCA6092083.1 hypothetical protein [Streptomyces sichuanensis]